MIGPTLRAAALLGVDLLPSKSDPGHDAAVRRLHIALVMAVRERWGGGRPLPVPSSSAGRYTSDRREVDLAWAV